MSLDSTQIGTIGAIASPAIALVNPIAGIAVSGAFSLATAGAAADEQRELTALNIRKQRDGIAEDIEVLEQQPGLASLPSRLPMRLTIAA